MTLKFLFFYVFWYCRLSTVLVLISGPGDYGSRNALGPLLPDLGPSGSRKTFSPQSSISNFLHSLHLTDVSLRTKQPSKPHTSTSPFSHSSLNVALRLFLLCPPVPGTTSLELPISSNYNFLNSHRSRSLLRPRHRSHSRRDLLHWV